MASRLKTRVLLVEDEPIIRAVGTDALEEAGFEVIEANDADHAVRILEMLGEVQVLFTDIRMPGSMNGLQLARLVHQRWPNMKILVTSGDTWPTTQQMPLEGHFLPKPYNLDVLQAEVTALLD
ncbi:DNA-binding NtrC family response regulator [Novosphingobium fluoreni]|uniref:DNA-binding NtrC family response regulator n=3 Tax=Novosphingobium TaxID=165696 RepID=A0A7W6BV06_9SPHN|nr:response regulator [uncultured Novosphingobium sp.]MBB3938479.1 DNA-binding NtrC family response regulator [Novosphingobium fluoreni]